MMTRAVVLILLMILPSIPATSQPQGFNYDESKVPHYELPDPLIRPSGERVISPLQWWDVRRPEIVALFESEMYGRVPEGTPEVRFAVVSEVPDALGGAATRKEVSIYFGDDARPRMDLLIYVPNDVDGPAPAFLGLNFYGNQTIHTDPGIKVTDQWVMNSDGLGMREHRATEASRGVRMHRWPVDAVLDRGYALVTAYYGDLDPDFDDGFENGVHGLMSGKPSQSEWGSIATWAWGLSRALDYLETDDHIDASQVAVLGHSRLGKAALWAGAIDQRFAMVISNNSGCGGAALSRRRFGETVARINEAFPHWFGDRFAAYGGREDDLPIDQHMLLALIAPRPLYVASASEDLWADPRGEFLSAQHASRVYDLLGVEGLPDGDLEGEMPPAMVPILGTIGYHLRSGTHDVTLYDWQQFLDFADRHFQ